MAGRKLDRNAAAGKLRPMTRFRWRRSTPRSLVFVLTVLLLLGHACELPVLAEAFAHVHESGHHAPGHHSPDHDPDANEVSCDALVGIRSSTGGSAVP